MHQDDLKENDKFILFCKIALGKTQARHSFPQTEATTFAFSSVFIFLLWIGHSILHTQVLWTVFRRRDILAVGGLKARPGKKAAF